MNELTLLRDFRAERAVDVPEAREAIWTALEARIEAAAGGIGGASATAGGGAGTAGTAPAARRRTGRARRRGHFTRRRRLLAFAAALGAAAVLAAILVRGSGPTAQPAAAEILHETATVAAASQAPADVPGPGQFYYRKSSRVALMGWLPPGARGGDEIGAMQGGVLPQADSFKALVPTTEEEWLSAEGAGRFRSVTGTPRFFTDAERRRWDAAGSPLPGERVTDEEHGPWRRFQFPDTSKLPTKPVALRRAVEANEIEVKGFNLVDPAANHLDRRETIEELINVLVEGNPERPRLRAAIFNALAELPGIKVDTDATDFLGRHGYSIRLLEPKTGNTAEYIFDPHTSEVLAERDTIGGPGGNRYLKGVPAGTTVRETDFLDQSVVDSTHEPAAHAEGGVPATPGPTYSR